MENSVIKLFLDSPRQGDYTKERHEWLDKTPLEDILTSIRQRQKDDATHYEEIIE